MAKRFVLIPEDLYQGLNSRGKVSTKYPLEDNLINFDSTKKNMNKILKYKSVNSSAKNTIFNQELLRYLKQRRDIVNKPVKVEMVSGGKYIKSSKTGTSVVLPEDDKEEFETTINDNSIFNKTSSSDLNKSINNSSDEKVNHNKNKIEIIYNFIMENQKEFGVSDKGKLYNDDNRLIKSSDLRKSINKIMNPDYNNIVPGHKILQERIKDNSFINEILSIPNSSKNNTQNISPKLWK
jgi:hypothetical protein